MDSYVACVEPDEVARADAAPYLLCDSDTSAEQDRWRASYTARRLGRAREIALSVRDDNRIDTTTAKLVELADRCLASEEPANVLFPLYELQHPRKHAPKQLTTIGTLALHRLADAAGAAHDMQHVAETINHTLDPDEQKEVWSQVVDAFERMAAKAEGPTRYALLRDAWELALDKGLTDRSPKLQQQLGQIDLSEFLEPVQTELTLTAEERAEFDREIDDFVDRLIDLSSPLRSLARYGQCEVVNVAETESAVASSPRLHTMFRTHHIAPRSAVAESEDARVWFDVVNRVVMAAKHWAFWVGVRFLERFHDAFADELDELANTIRLEPIWSDESAQRFVEILRLIGEQRVDAACHLAAPVIEQTYREWAHLAGLLQRPQPREGVLAEPPGLGAVLSSLEGQLPEQTRRWLKILLVDTPGLNMRNSLSHGTARFPDMPETALLVHALCLPLAIRKDTAD